MKPKEPKKALFASFKSKLTSIGKKKPQQKTEESKAESAATNEKEAVMEDPVIDV